MTGCAGDLKDPQRFDAVLASFGDAGTGASGSGGSRAGGSGGTSGSSGSGGSGGSGMVMPGDAGMASGDAPPMCVADLFKSACGMPSCHNSGSLVLDLVSPGVQARLLDKKSTGTICKDRTFIDTSGGASLLITKLDATPPCGSRMPLIGMLTTAQRTCLEGWVSQLGGTP